MERKKTPHFLPEPQTLIWKLSCVYSIIFKQAILQRLLLHLEKGDAGWAFSLPGGFARQILLRAVPPLPRDGVSPSAMLGATVPSALALCFG